MGRFQAITDRFISAANRHDPDAVAATYAEDCVVSDPRSPAPILGRAPVRAGFVADMRAFPDLRFEVLELLEKDDLGMAEMRLSGTNTGPLVTPMGELPATGKRVELNGAVFVRVDEDGLMVEEHRYFDTAAMMRQLGVMPEPAEVAVH
jgi:steroid delta-isomerase-like uncharacterized protein